MANSVQSVGGGVPASAPLLGRWIERTGIEPWKLGAGVGLLLGFVPLGIEWREGHIAMVLAGDVPWIIVRAPVVAMLLIGLTPALHLYLVRWTRRSLERIAPLIEGEVPEAPPSARPGLLSGLVGVGLFLFFFVAPQDVTALAKTSVLHQYFPWPMVGGLGWLIGRLAAGIARDARLVSQLATRLHRVDLLDPSAFEPFVHQGLRGSLPVLVLMTITSVLALAPGQMVVGSAIIMVAAVGLAAAALLLPLRGAHRELRAEKARQLHALREQIDVQRRAVLAGTAANEDLARLPGLLSLEARLEAVREWPFDTGNLARFGLYVTIGLGSWVGAAVVERFIDWSLGG